MGTQLTKRQEAELISLTGAKDIQDAKLILSIDVEHKACTTAAAAALEHAFRAGEYLIEAKSRRKHGEWLPWLAEHFDGASRTAQLYMKLATNREKITEAIQSQSATDHAHLTIQEAIKLLAPPKHPTPLVDKAFPVWPAAAELSDELTHDLPPLGGRVGYLLRCEPDCVAQLVPTEWAYAFHVSVWHRDPETGELDIPTNTIRPQFIDHEGLMILLEVFGVESVTSWEAMKEPLWPHPSAA